LPKLSTDAPPSGVVWFARFLQDRVDLPSALVVDIGSGKGRNAIHLAEHGCEVWGLEYIEEAVVISIGRARSKGLESRMHFDVAEIVAPWNVDSNFFDVAVDSFSRIDIETLQGRQVCRDELFRTLKPGGLALITVCSAEDEFEREIMAASPGSEPNSAVWPETGKFQKNYDEDELRSFYSQFDINELMRVQKPTSKLGRHYVATNLWLVLQKPPALED
jgi:SAM-dependent methyltransferase